MEANNVLTNLKNKSKQEAESNIQFRKNSIRLYLRRAAVVLFLLTSILLGSYLFNKWRMDYITKEKIKGTKLPLITSDSGDIQLKISLDNIGEININNCVIVDCGYAKEIGLLTNDNKYLITSFKLASIKEPIFVELPNEEVLKGDIIEEDKLKGLIVVKMKKHTDNEEFINQLDSKRYVYYKQIVDTDWKMYLDKILNTQNIVIGSQKAYFVSVPKSNPQDDKSKDPSISKLKYNSGMIICNQFGEVLGADFLNDTAAVDEGSYSFVDTKYLNAIIDKQLDNTYSTLKEWGLVVKEAKDTKGNIEGIYIKNIDKGSPLYGIGIYPTDIILQVQNKKIINIQHLALTLDECKNDYCVYFKVMANGKVNIKSVVIN